nr:reverse transcriptase domain-containing protein [Tanacetum cinerariifolium]GEW97037.1 reverse transcriptase domain-containing protein [Tanacetum cinerariifolium]
MNLSQQEPLRVGKFVLIIINSMKQPLRVGKNRYGLASLRIPSGLCNCHTPKIGQAAKSNASDTFQRCMLAIFHDMIKESVEVFMEDFSVFGNSFDNCLNNLDKMLQHFNDANLVLNWEKCHSMVKEGIVLRHKVSGAGLEVDKAKINVISKLLPPLILKALEGFWDMSISTDISLKTS